jgi:hypothetical protein
MFIGLLCRDSIPKELVHSRQNVRRGAVFEKITDFLKFFPRAGSARRNSAPPPTLAPTFSAMKTDARRPRKSWMANRSFSRLACQ